MKIAYITAGAAGMYCGSCIHDNTLAAALQRKGHEVALIPTYTPTRTDEPNVSIDHIFYGGINVYLQQKLALFRHTPWFLDATLDRPILLNWISRFTSTTNASDLGAMTVSVLRGDAGYQQKELAKLIHWLKNSFRPDIVHLTNSMFLGLAQPLKKALKVPILCALQGEDVFLANLIEPYKSEAFSLLRNQASSADGFLASGQYYANFMSDYLGFPRQQIHVVKLGLNLKNHGTRSRPIAETPFVIGYLARICPEKGLHILVEAFRELTQRLEPNKLRLAVAGYMGPRDRPYFKTIQKQLSTWGLSALLDYRGEVDRGQKIDFLNSLHVLSVPTTYREAKGLFVLEALANGIPVVQPRHGSFPELIDATGGGILVEPNSPSAVADGLHSLLLDSDKRKRLGQQGKAAVHNDFGEEVMAEETLAMYRQFLS